MPIPKVIGVQKTVINGTTDYVPFTANMYPMLCVEYPEITSHDNKTLHYLKIFLLIRIRCNNYLLNYTHFYRIIVKYHSNIGRSTWYTYSRQKYFGRSGCDFTDCKFRSLNKMKPVTVTDTQKNHQIFQLSRIKYNLNLKRRQVPVLCVKLHLYL